MRAALFVALLYLIALRPSGAQSCPEENPNGPPKDSAVRSLSGKLVYHDEIRQWLGLKLDAPVCGQTDIQLFPPQMEESREAMLDVLRGCRVTTQGVIGIAMTGYYSTDLYQTIDKIEATPDCVRQPAFPDYSKLKPDPSIHSYSVSMRLDYRERGGHIDVKVHNGDRLLAPWQPYASYILTGGYVFYANCAEGFTVSNLRGTPEAKPDLGVLDNFAAIDPEAAAEKHIRRITLAYICRRDMNPSNQSTSK